MFQHILVVDDDSIVLDFVERYLKTQGFEVSTADSGAAFRQQLAKKRFDLVILDLNLPDEDGLELARHIRKSSGLPIIMLSGRSDAIDRIVGLEIGADDYLTKPFEARELLARIKSVLRRSAKAEKTLQEPDETDKVAHFSGWRLNLVTRRLSSPKGDEVHLTTAEFDLLSTFARHSARVLSRNQLLDLARGREAFPYDRSIDVHVMHIRRKIEEDPQEPTLIKSVHGVGYVFTPKVEWS